MKVKNLGFAVIVMTFSISSYSQIGRLFAAVDEVEILAGPSLVSFRGVERDYEKLKIGYSAGVGLLCNLNERTSVSIKLLAERKGIKYSFQTTYFDNDMNPLQGRVTQRFNLNYISIPVLLGYSLNSCNSLLIEGGFYVSYLYKSQNVTEISWGGKDVYNGKDRYKKFDAGISSRIRYSIPLNDHIKMSFWVSAAFGLLNVGEPSGATGFREAKNYSISVGTSLIIPLKK